MIGVLFLKEPNKPHRALIALTQPNPTLISSITFFNFGK